MTWGSRAAALAFICAIAAGCGADFEEEPRLWAEHLLPAETERGLTLLAPVAGKELLWVTMAGRVAKRLELPWKVSLARQLDGGTVLLIAGLGLIDGLVEIDGRGEVVWKHQPSLGLVHHEVLRTPRNTTMFLVQRQHDDPEMIYDVIVEVDATGETLWMWNPLAHYDPTDPETSLERGHPWYGLTDWLHLNSLDLFENGDVLLSIRNLNRIVRISYPDGAIVWSWGDGILGHQHAATVLDNGNVLLFDNGSYPTPGKICASAPCSSRAVEFDPETQEIVWSFEPRGLYSLGFGNAQRLANGNTLLNFGQYRSGALLLEVTADGRSAWFLHSTIRTRYVFGGVPAATLYRAQRVDRLPVDR